MALPDSINSVLSYFSHSLCSGATHHVHADGRAKRALVNESGGINGYVKNTQRLKVSESTGLTSFSLQQIAGADQAPAEYESDNEFQLVTTSNYHLKCFTIALKVHVNGSSSGHNQVLFAHRTNRRSSQSLRSDGLAGLSNIHTERERLRTPRHLCPASP